MYCHLAPIKLFALGSLTGLLVPTNMTRSIMCFGLLLFFDRPFGLLPQVIIL